MVWAVQQKITMKKELVRLLLLLLLGFWFFLLFIAKGCLWLGVLLAF